MAKLSNSLLCECLKNYPNDKPDGVSDAQWKKFDEAMIGESLSGYITDFVNSWYNFNGSPDDFFKEKTSIAEPTKPVSGGSVTLPKDKPVTGARFVFTSAQNNTDTHTPFFQSLKNYCMHNNAQLIIGKYTYNKNGFQNDQTTDDALWYAPELTAYFVDERREILPDLLWCGELNILPTVKNPLTGLETYGKRASLIVPHAKIALESIPTAKKLHPKMLYATGTITQHNYIQKRAGQLAQASHCYGALVVELKEGLWFVRQIQTDESGSFQDLTTIYNPDGTRERGEILAINWGDIHAEKSDINVIDTCIEVLDSLHPKNQFFHDTLDMTARNHHNRKSGHFLAEKFYLRKDNVEADIQKAANILQAFERVFSDNYIVESNHDLALQSWLDSNDYNFKTDPTNALFYLKLQTVIYHTLSENNEMPNVLEAGFNVAECDMSEFNFLTVDDSIILAGVEFGAHGHLGLNGAKGSPGSFQKLNTPMNTGHTHAASIKGSIYTAGVTGSLDQGYNKGASNWTHSHILTYPNGMRTIITMMCDSSGFWCWSA